MHWRPLMLANSENRENALQILLRLVDEPKAEVSPMDFLCILAAQQDRWIVSRLSWTIKRVYKQLPPSAQPFIELLVLKDQFLYIYNDIKTLVSFSRVTQSRIAVSSAFPDMLGELAMSERFNLATQRLSAIIADPKCRSVDLEVWAKDVFEGDLEVFPGRWIDADPSILCESDRERLFGLLEVLVAGLLDRIDILRGLVPNEIVDYVFCPLAWFQSNTTYARKSRCFYAQICQKIALHVPDYSHLALAWLKMPARITDGANLRDAIDAYRAAVGDLDRKWEYLGETDCQLELSRTGLEACEAAVKGWCGDDTEQP
jgi:hypothetical protein